MQIVLTWLVPALLLAVCLYLLSGSVAGVAGLVLCLAAFAAYLLPGRRLDALLACALLFLCLLPLLGIDGAETSSTENRALARYVPLFRSGRLNWGYGRDFDSWLNDHFFLRKEVMERFGLWQSAFNGRFESKSARAGRDGWWFLQGDLRRIANYHEDEPENFARTAEALSRFGDFCKRSGCELCILVAPYGEEVYSEKVIGMRLEGLAGRIGGTVERLRAATGVNIAYAYDDMMARKQDGLVCYKTDHHWTRFGAYLGYARAMQALGLQGRREAEYDKGTVTVSSGWGATFRLLNLPEKYVERVFPAETEYLSMLRKFPATSRDDGRDLIVNSKGNGRTVFVFGDSYTDKVKGFFGDSFSRTYYWLKPLQIYMPDAENKILRYRPDVVVMVVFAQNFELIKNWYSR